MSLEDLPPGSPLDVAYNAVLREHERAVELWGPMASPHEGYAVVLEELDELWELVKADKGDPAQRAAAMRREATQLAAMVMRFLTDCCP